jgi:hypothetical protein
MELLVEDTIDSAWRIARQRIPGRFSKLNIEINNLK